MEDRFQNDHSEEDDDYEGGNSGSEISSHGSEESVKGLGFIQKTKKEKKAKKKKNQIENSDSAVTEYENKWKEDTK